MNFTASACSNFWRCFEWTCDSEELTVFLISEVPVPGRDSSYIGTPWHVENNDGQLTP